MAHLSFHPFTTKSFIFDFLFCYSFSFGLLIIIVIYYDVAVYLMSLKCSYYSYMAQKLPFGTKPLAGKRCLFFVFCLPIYFWFMAKCTFTE